MNRAPCAQSGNILIYILGAIFLLGLLVVLVKGSFQEGTGTDSEKVVLKAQQIQSYASELERGVNYVLRNGVSESDIRFAAPNAPSNYGTYSDNPNMVFAPSGGGVEYKDPPAGVNDGTKWGFFGTTHIANMGSDAVPVRKAELIAVLPNVTQAFCSQINRNVKQAIDLSQSADVSSNGYIYQPTEPFLGTFRSGNPANNLLDASFTFLPPTEACVRAASSPVSYHYYKVLLAR